MGGIRISCRFGELDLKGRDNFEDLDLKLKLSRYRYEGGKG
jgi:hypothetical protein